MISTPISRPSKNMELAVFRTRCLLILFVFLTWSQVLTASENTTIPPVSTDGMEACLLTFGPGEIYFERLGHNSISLREPATGLDHTYKFGYFDFEQENFFLRFMQGRMLYFSVAQPANREFAYYRQQNRSIRAQKLRLTTNQFEQLRDYLLNQVQPENRNYRYDYYLNNCSTRIRDALDVALDGALSSRSGQAPAQMNFRDHTRRLTEMQFWYYLGLETGLGYPVDKPVTRWDEMFIPMVVADEIAAMSVATPVGSEPLVDLDAMFYTSSVPLPGAAPGTTWPRYLLLGLLLSGLAWLSGKFMPPLWLAALCRAWVLINATMGLVLAFLWLLTDHEASRANANLLLLNPLLFLAFVTKLQRTGAVMLIAGTLLALLLQLLPVHQYNLDVIALIGPLNIAVAFYLFKRRPDKTQL